MNVTGENRQNFGTPGVVKMPTAEFTIQKNWRNHQTGESGVNRRFWKLVYTAALRLGKEINPDEGHIHIKVNVEPHSEVKAHKDNHAYIGEITINGSNYSDIVVIAGANTENKFHLISFWPRSQHPDAHKSYTDPLTDTAMAGTPFPVNVVASDMHSAFTENPGVSPAALMKKIYDNRDILSQEKISELGSALDDALVIALKAQEEASQAREAEAVALQILKQEQELSAELKGTVTTQDSALQQKDSLIQDQTIIIQELQSELEEMRNHQQEELVDFEPARQVTSVWRSKTGSDYLNVGIRAHIKSVNRAKHGDTILLTYIGKNSEEATISDFGYQGFVRDIFSYLSSHINQEAIFLITWKPGQPSPKLASDTMLLPQYSPLWKNQQPLIERSK